MFTKVVLIAAILGNTLALRKSKTVSQIFERFHDFHVCFSRSKFSTYLLQPRNLVIGGGALNHGAYRFFTKLETSTGICGASLIAPELLLTAAHWCVLFLLAPSLLLFDVKHLHFAHTTSPSSSVPETAQVGFLSNSNISQSINISASFDHPAFNPVSLFYDFKVIKLASPAGPDPVIVPLNSNSSFPTDRETWLVMGIGDSDSSSAVGNAGDFVLQGSWVREETKSQCEDTRGLSVSYADSILESMVCAIKSVTNNPSARGANACNGDNGGPLMAADYSIPRPADDVGVQIGVVSW